LRSQPSRVRARRTLFLALTVHGIAALVSAVLSRTPADLNRYYEIGRHPGRPYLDYPVEQPIGATVIFKTLARIPGGRLSFGLAVVGLTATADAIIVAALVWGWGVPAAAAYTVLVLPIIDLVFNRVDVWSTAAAALAVAAWRRDRAVPLGSALAIGGALKLWPLVLAPLVVIPRAGSTLSAWRPTARGVNRPAMAAFGITGAAVALLALWLAGWNSTLQVLTFRGATGWQIESVAGSLIHLAGSATLRDESGSWRIGTTSGPISIAMFVAAAPLCLWSSWRGARFNRVSAGWLGAVSVLLLFSALLSAQFVIWLAPAAAIAWAEGDRRSGRLAGLAVVLTGAFWRSYPFLLAGWKVPLLTVVLRNALLAVLAVRALAGLAEARPSPETTPV
jgi:hypothetical protein